MSNEEIVKAKVCADCGGILRIKEISENSCFTDHKEVVRPYVICETCSKIARGVDEEVFRLARKLVTDFGFKYYTHLSPVDDGEEYCLRANTGGATNLAFWILDEQKKLVASSAVQPPNTPPIDREERIK